MNEDGSPIVMIEYGFSFHHHFFLKQMIAKKLSIEVLGFAPLWVWLTIIGSMILGQKKPHDAIYGRPPGVFLLLWHPYFKRFRMISLFFPNLFL